MDPISNMINTILNSYTINSEIVFLSFSRIKFSILNLLRIEGYIGNLSVINKNKKIISVQLKYYNDAPVITFFKRVSKPSLRVYRGYKNLPRFMNGLGVFIISTNKGIITDKYARKIGIGGELICYVF